MNENADLGFRGKCSGGGGGGREGDREGGGERGKSDRSIGRPWSAFSSPLDKETASSRSRQVERGVCVCVCRERNCC